MTPKRFMLAAAFIISIYATAYGAFYQGLDVGRSGAYDRGHAKGLAEGKADNEAAIALLSDKNNSLQTDYNKLVEDYNSLYKQATSYINTAQFQSRQPLHCSSTTYGTDFQYTSTNCY